MLHHVRPHGTHCNRWALNEIGRTSGACQLDKEVHGYQAAVDNTHDTGPCTERNTHIQTHRQTHTVTEWMDRDRQTDRHTDRQTTHMHHI